MEFLESIMPRLPELFGPQVMRVFMAVLILFAGWVLARLIAWTLRKALEKTTIDNKIAAMVAGDKKADQLDVEGWTSKMVYYILLLMVLMAFFNALNLEGVSQPINALLTKVFGYVPQLFAGAALGFLAWLLASASRRVVSGVAGKWQLDDAIREDAGSENLGKTLGDASYYLVFLLVLPMILQTLGLEGLLAPVQSMMDRLLSFLPNVLAAAVILAVGWFIARVVQRIVTNLLGAVGLDDVGERVGLGSALGTKKLSGLLGLIVYVFILFNVLLSSLNALQLEAITRPASNMLEQVLEAIPHLFAAGILLALAFYVGRVVSTLLSNLLAGAGFNNVLQRLGLARADSATGERSPSEIVGALILTIIMLFASIEAAGLLGFENLAVLLSGLLEFAGQMVLGIVVFGVGLFLANLAADTIRSSSNAQAPFLAIVARVAIVVLAGAIGLRQMGIANEIIELAFGFLLGSVAVAAAIAFGLGGRDVAGRQIEEWRQSLKG